MTKAQSRLLDELRATDGWVRVSGPKLRVAERLAKAGLAEIRVGGSGIPWRSPWWLEARAKER